MRIIVAGALSNPPFAAGSAWTRLHYVLGLLDLGHDVYFLEETRPDWCVGSSGRRAQFSESANVRLFARTMHEAGLSERACLCYDGGKQTWGIPFDRLVSLAGSTDLLINMSGHATAAPVLEAPNRRMYLDQDPVYTQLWQAEYGIDLNFEHHDVFATVGLNIGTARSHIPDCDVEWLHVLPPVVLDRWTNEFDHSAHRFTTIAAWTVFGDLAHAGEWYRSKRPEFRRFASLPRTAGVEAEIVVKNLDREDPEMVETLAGNGWRLTDGGGVVDLHSYQRFIASSRAEIGIAKNAYVKGRSGWFSERSAHYLAAGKPVLAQSTGFEPTLPTGKGLLSFSTLEEAVAGIDSINAEYEIHCRDAREMAEGYLDHQKVLPAMLEAAGAKR